MMSKRGCALMIIGFLSWLLLMVVALPTAHAEAPWPVVREHLYGPPRYVAFVADLNAPAVVVPVEFAVQSERVISCESRWNPEAVGKAGEKGLLQIHPVHKPRMQSMGLDFESERDRVAFAVVLWQEQGWKPWSCRP